MVILNRDGARISIQYDPDDNGVIDRIESFVPGAGKPDSVAHDRDQNGMFEEIIDHHADDATSRWIDGDGDGIFDTREYRDAEGKMAFIEHDQRGKGFVRRAKSP